MQIKVIETIEKNFTDIYISFSGYIEDVKFFEFIPECEVNDKQVWESLCYACINGKSESIDWTPNNGKCYISVTEKFVEFCTAKYGDGQGGAMMVRVPVGACIEPFKNIVKILKEN